MDGNTGSDSNPGTQAEPFKTISKAAAVAVVNNQQGVGTRVTINSATYHESIALKSSSSSTSLPITFEAATKGTVQVSGTDAWTGWQPYSANANIYTHAWPYAWGLCPRETSGPTEQAINLRREMIFVNQASLTQVLSLPQLMPGTFFVDESGATVYIYPAIGTDTTTADIEVATRGALFSSNNVSNIVLRGIQFERANDCRHNDTVTFNRGSNILVDSDSFNWNNSGGFGISSATLFTVRNSTAKHNGQRGFKSFEAKNGVWANNESDYNNWRGAQGGIYGWGAGGFYFYAQHNNSISNLRMFFNMTHALHWDTDNANITATNLTAAYSLRDGLVVEKSEGPVFIGASHACFNAPMNLYYDGGMVVRASNAVTLANNSFANNFGGQISIIGIQGGVVMPVTNYETGQQYELYTSNLTQHWNVVQSQPGQQLFDDFDQSGAAWTALESTLVSDHNTWWNPSGSPALHSARAGLLYDAQLEELAFGDGTGYAFDVHGSGHRSHDSVPGNGGRSRLLVYQLR